MENKKVILFMLGFLIVICLATGVSYAYWKNDKSNTVNTGDKIEDENQKEDINSEKKDDKDINKKIEKEYNNIDENEIKQLIFPKVNSTEASGSGVWEYIDIFVNSICC